jgi:hypothetical protein
MIIYRKQTYALLRAMLVILIAAGTAVTSAMPAASAASSTEAAASPAAYADVTPDELTDSIDGLLNNGAITANVYPVTHGKHPKYGVRLEGTLNSQTEIDAALTLVRSLQPDPVAVVRSELVLSPDQNDTPERLTKILQRLLNGEEADKPIKVVVAKVSAGEYAVRLSGKLENQEQIDAAIAAVEPLKPSPVLTLNTADLTTDDKPKPAPVEQVERWHMTFLPLGVKPLDPNNEDLNPKSDTIDGLVQTINRIYGTEKKPAVERANYGELLIRGGPDTRLQVKRLLALIDTPWPQVQTNMWAIQVSGGQRDVGKRVREIRYDIDNTRMAVAHVQQLMNRVINREANRFELGGFAGNERQVDLLKKAEKLGFHAKPTGPLSLNEALIYFAIDPARMTTTYPTLAERLAQAMSTDPCFAMNLPRIIQARNAAGSHLGSVPMPRFVETFRRYNNVGDPVLTSENPDLHGIEFFVEQLAQFQHPDQSLAKKAKVAGAVADKAQVNADAARKRADNAAPGDKALLEAAAVQAQEAADKLNEDYHVIKIEADDKAQRAPIEFAAASACTDRLLKQAVDAYASDMDEMYFQPLLSRCQENARGTAGVSLVGQSRIVVTSNIEARLAPQMSSFVETTRPRPFGKELLDLAFPQTRSSEAKKEGSIKTKGSVKTADGKTTVTGPDVDSSSTESSSDSISTDKLTRAQLLLSTLSPGAALGLAAALSNYVPPTFANVAPGIAVNIRPTVMPDGGAARMIIDANFGVKTTVIGDAASRTDVENVPQPTGISSHSIRTDTVVSAFDLFDLSHLSVSTSTPQAPEYIPILGRLPFLGPLFQRPRGNKDVEYESIILVNSVILPRSMDMARFYAGN